MAEERHPAITVVIPTYNHARFLEQALRSVVEQSFSDWEAIVVNNYSQDNTVEVVESFDDQRIRLVNFHNHGVIAASRNEGIRRSNADLIAFLDSDDVWFPTKLEKVVSFFQENSCIDVVCHDLIEVSQAGAKRLIKCKRLKGAVYEELLFVGNGLFTSATVVRGELIKEIEGFSEDPSFNSAEDYECWMRLAKAGAKFGQIQEALGEYNLVEGSVSQRLRYHVDNVFNVVVCHLNMLVDENEYPSAFLQKIRRQRWASGLFFIGYSHHRLGELKRARQYYWKAIKSRPFWWKSHAGYMRTFLGELR